MLVKEMHIAIDLGLQSINANKRRLIQPEEKDRILNDCQLEYIKKIVDNKLNAQRTGFEEDSIRYNDLISLKKSASLSLYKQDAFKTFTILPEDYSIHINSAINSYYNCNTISTNTTTRNIQGCVLYFPDDTTSNTFKYSNLIFSVYDSNGDDKVQFGYTQINNKTYRDKTAKFEIVNIILNHINDNNYDFNLYWETYDNIYHKDSFIVIFKPNTINNQSGYINYKTCCLSYTNYTGGTTCKMISNINSFQQYVNTANRSYPSRIVSSEDILKLNNTFFGKTKYYSPLATIIGKRIYIFNDTRFLPVSLDLEYIKKPRVININTNSNCELNETSQIEIVNLAIQRIQARIIAENYQLSANENKNI